VTAFDYYNWDLTNELIRLEAVVAVSILLQRLNFTRRERALLDRMMADEPASLRSIASRFGVSPQAVSRTDQQLKQRLRHELEAMRIYA
jgi:DNA-directed RNA polymerase specialized sigma subunit